MLLDPSQPAVAYLLGLLQTDGSHYGRLEGKGKVSLELNSRDAATLEALRAFIPCYTSIRFRTRRTNFAAASTTATLGFFNQAVRRELATLGLPPGAKATTVAPPPSPNLARAPYLRGLLDGDGSVGWTARGMPFVSFITASEPLVRYVEAETLRVTGSVRQTRRNARDGAFNVMVANGPAAVLAAYAWTDAAGPAIARKRVRAQEVAQWRAPEGQEGRFGVRRRAWCPAEDAIVLSRPPTEAAQVLGRTLSSVGMRRWRLLKADLSDLL